MAINPDTRADVDEIRAFADGVAALYYQSLALRGRIQRYIDGAAAVATDTATAREAKFVEMVRTIVSADDLARIGALLPTIETTITLLATDYADFLT